MKESIVDNQKLLEKYRKEVEKDTKQLLKKGKNTKNKDLNKEAQIVYSKCKGIPVDKIDEYDFYIWMDSVQLIVDKEYDWDVVQKEILFLHEQIKNEELLEIGTIYKELLQYFTEGYN